MPERREQRRRKRRHEGEREHERRRDAQHVRPREQLRGQVDPERTVAGDARHHQPHRGRDQERRQGGEQRIADREDRERLDRLQRRHPVVERADHDSADQVQHDDHERGDGVALHEFPGAVHRGVEIGLALHARPFATRRVGIQHAGVQIRIDRHLLPRHRVEREPRAHLGDPLGAVGDDDELDRDEDREHDQSDHHVTAYDERAEGGDQRPDPARIVAFGQDQARRADVEREPEQRREQQRRREGGELQRLFDPQADQQHERRAEHVERQQQIEQRRRQRYDQDRDDPDHRNGETRRDTVRHASAPSRASDAMICATAT